ncbi:MAG: hypothetical protein KGN36_17245 [Acidobacteriota bacterium]|nr:hypothetical protein [Acidobacteriota bacterium]
MKGLYLTLRWAALAVMLAAATPAQVSILRIQVAEGDGTVHAPGSRGSHPLTVAVTDETGKPVSGAAVSFHLPEDGPGGSFANGLRTDVATTDAKGRATVRAFQANRLPGRFQIRIVASKEQARAGTVVFQYIGGTGPAPAARAAARSGSRRWFLVAAAAGTGVLAAALASHGSSSSAVPAAAPAASTPAVVLTIGAPTITVGHP